MTMPRTQGLTELYFAGDVLVFQRVGYLKQITVTQVGGAAGNKVVLRDGIDATAVPAVTIVFSSASDTKTINYPEGKAFVTGLFIDAQGAGQIEGDLTFK